MAVTDADRDIARAPDTCNETDADVVDAIEEWFGEQALAMARRRYQLDQRIGQLCDEAEAKLRDLETGLHVMLVDEGIDEITAEDIRLEAAHLVRQRGRETACWCTHCGVAIEADAPVWRYRSDPVCEDCYPSWWDCWPRPCDGCGREVWSDTLGARTCSERCQADVRNRRRRDRRAEQRKKLCKGCGREFVGTRSDATFCSNACRQAAYRARVTDEGKRSRPRTASRNADDRGATA